jgi:hypothetical protein
MTDRKHPSAALWITVALVVVVVGYPLSFGPACWLASRNGTEEPVSQFYWPIGWVATELGAIGEPIFWYAEVGMEPDTMILIPIDSSGNTTVVFDD